VLAGQWKKEILAHASSPEDKLYCEIGRLKIEVDWAHSQVKCNTRVRF
jgi:hypothetical protein